MPDVISPGSIRRSVISVSSTQVMALRIRADLEADFGPKLYRQGCCPSTRPKGLAFAVFGPGPAARTRNEPFHAPASRAGRCLPCGRAERGRRFCVENATVVTYSVDDFS